MLNDDTHAQHICNSKRVVLFRVALFLLNACLSQNLYISSESVFFFRCNNTCTSFSKCYIIKQLLTNEALYMMWYRPENTNIDLGFASNASLVNNCIRLNAFLIFFMYKIIFFLIKIIFKKVCLPSLLKISDPIPKTLFFTWSRSGPEVI